MRFMQIRIEYPEYIEMLFLLLNQDVVLKPLPDIKLDSSRTNLKASRMPD
jgi:hypothetical protein